MTTTQVSEVPLGGASRHGANPLNKRARVSSAEHGSFSVRLRSYDGNSNSHSNTTPVTAYLPTVSEKPRSNLHTAGSTPLSGGRIHGNNINGGRTCTQACPPRPASPTPSYASSSTFSAATTSATALSSRASLSSCRSSFTSSYSRSSSSSYRWKSRADRESVSSRRSNRSSRPHLSSSRPSSSSPYTSSSSAVSGGGSGGGGCVDYFPKPSSSWSGRGRSTVGGGGGASGWRRGGSGLTDERRRDTHRDRCSSRSSRERHLFPPPIRCSADKDYASEASGSSGSRKRHRSCSRERGSGNSSSSSSSSSSLGRKTAEVCSGVECARCREWCRTTHAPKTPIARTLQMDYWVRTANCKAAKTKHIDFIDDVAYSREQFIEETVFTCPFTGARRDIVLERNMFPYDVPTDVEHWTLWSRRDLPNDEMEAFVQRWAAENHPHAVEWECDNNEGERSIDWFHVHVFFRLGCEDRTGVPRDPASVYDGPCRSSTTSGEEEEEEEEGAVVGVVVSGSDEDDSDGDRTCVVVTDCE